MALSAKDLKALRATFESTIVDIKGHETFCEQMKDEGLDELEFRQQVFLPLISKLMDCFGRMYIELPIDEQPEYKSDYEDAKSRYFKTAAITQAKIRQLQAKEQRNANAVPPEASQTLRCPKLTLPEFDGTIEKWVKFRDLFESMVHNNTKLSDIEKFQYLHMAVKIPSTQCNVLDNYPMTTTNYADAWNSLNERYNDKMKIVATHISALMSVKKMTGESAPEMRRIIDAFASNINALKHLGYALQDADDFANVLLVNMMLCRLDEQTLKEWKKHNSNQPFTYKTLSEYLLVHWRSLEDVPPNKKSFVKPFEAKQSQSTSKPSSSKSHSASSSTGEVKCVVCGDNHFLWKCQKFQSMSVPERFQLVRSNNLCFNCFSSQHSSKSCSHKGRCKTCNKLHHSMLHMESREANDQKPKQSSQDEKSTLTPSAKPFTPFPVNKGSSEQSSSSFAQSHSFVIKRKSLLSTALVGVLDIYGNVHHGRALMDTGSDTNFMTTSFALQSNLELINQHMTLKGIGDKTTICKHSTTATVVSRYGEFENKLEFTVMPQVTGCIPHRDINIDHLDIPSDYFLADPTFFQSSNVDMILNDDIYYDSWLLEKKKFNNGPWMIHTKFGWIVAGSIQQNISSSLSLHVKTPQSLLSCFTKKVHYNVDGLDEKLDKFFTMEEVDSIPLMTPEDEYCEQLYSSTTRRGDDGRYIVFMPFKSTIDELGNNFNNAIRQYYVEENSRMKDDKRQQMTVDYINAYLDSKHMQKVESSFKGKCYYMPQHDVVKMESSTTKSRRVSNASSKSQSGFSLNDAMCTGPVVQPELFDILIRSREGRFIITGDISKMYLQIWIDPSQRCYLRVLWRFNKSEKVEHYEMTTVTFGTKSAPFLATRTIVQIANDNEIQFPQAAQIIKKCIYVDDLCFSTDDIKEGIKIRDQIRYMFAQAGMYLRKFTSNNAQLLENLPNKDMQMSNEDNHMMKTLGVSLDAKIDKYSYHIKHDKDDNVLTKAKVLSIIASIFDPIGWIGPVVLVLKIFMKKLWLRKVDWNHALPEDLDDEWRKLYDSLIFLDDVRVDRQCFITNHQSIEIHAFSDASENGYGTSIYTRSIDSQGNIQTSLICAKSKVAPKNQKTLARLELCGALLMSKLVARVLKIFCKPIQEVVLWTDSTIVLNWIDMTPATLNTFVGNRVAAIQELSSKFSWRHIRTNENPADAISRGLSAQDIISSQLWWKGPSFFNLPQSQWPESIIHLNPTDEEVTREVKKTFSVIKTDSMLEYIDTRFSRPRILINVFAFIQRFIHNSKNKREDRRYGSLSVQEQDDAEAQVIKIIQLNMFQNEYKVLCKQKELKHKQQSVKDEAHNVPQIARKSTIVSLSPFMDDNGVMRVRGRISNSPELTYDQKHQIILPQCHFATILIRHLHNKYLHPGEKAMFNFVRQKYWIIRCKSTIKNITFRCMKCYRVKPKDIQQIMADLPPSRVIMTPPFHSTAIDYAGFYDMKSGYTRNAPIIKCYICLFKCMCTGAIHLDVVSDLTAQKFIATLERFISRRGLCKEIFSDNATCFQGASNELKSIVMQNDPIVKEHCTDNGIIWQFTTPRAPHAGGIYESGIKSMKHHFKRILTDNPLNFEEFTTVSCKVEAILNSRPMTPMTENADDLRALTPGHFLVGRPLIAKPERDVKDVATNRLVKWQQLQKFTQMLWSEWYQDYLHLLQERPKHFREEVHFKVGDMVIVKESNMPPLKWMLGRITQLFPNKKDNVVRNVKVRTATGEKERHVKYLCLLPFEDSTH